ncbi:mitofilin family membrane protein [Rhizobium oryziradicis]|uniref:YbgF trimerisation domain-containing protein n=1 Tax=Rhizobium oryziradicis TaxID=1867956 RepID=A0A1Q8ZLK0_9HYPH|nr:mitofilin family membrane protein [Rhizobium oryziradicis]OLP42776.1 hypothetical protein BJF95_01260 [Rhizobium oryziradicis]
MVSGKPPRRSKTTEEPVIIDLKATEIAPEKPPEEPATSPEPTTEPSKQSSKEPAVEATAPPPEPQKVDAEIAATPASHTPEPETPAENHAFEDASKSEPESEAKAAAEAQNPEAEDGTEKSNSTSAFAAHAPRPEEEQAAPVAPSSSNTSSLLAAGIAGGLIALLAAGSIQYAGLLPAMGSGNSDKVAALSAEVESLKQMVAKGQPAADTSALEARLAQLESAKQNPAESVDPTTITELQTKLASTEQTIDQLKSDVTGRIQSLTSGQSDLSDKLTAIQTKLDRPRDDIEVARAIAASALKTAADRGGPFLAELRTLGSIVPEDPAVKALEPYATTGTASRAELLQRFGPVADSILSAINQPAESANIGERLMASAMSIIKVRPVGNVAGDSPSAIVARIEDKIRNGDLKGAAAEWETLPEAGRNVSASFKKALDASIAVEAQVSDALARSVAGRQG